MEEKMTVVNTKWEKTRKEILQTPKFLARGTKVIIYPKTVPHPMEVEGRYGLRKMYVVETREYGLIYVSPLQLVKIVEAFKGKFDSGITIEL